LPSSRPHESFAGSNGASDAAQRIFAPQNDQMPLFLRDWLMLDTEALWGTIGDKMDNIQSAFGLSRKLSM
jgi:hypothetical protein